MKKYYLISLTLLSGLVFSSCMTSNHRQDIRPGIDGLHKVIINTDDVSEGNREAVRQSETYCNEINKSAFFFNDDTKNKSANKATINTTPAATKKADDPTIQGNVTEGGSKKYIVDMLFKCL